MKAEHTPIAGDTPTYLREVALRQAPRALKEPLAGVDQRFIQHMRVRAGGGELIYLV